jgi:hypothetical protein
MQTIEEMINAARAKIGKISSLLERQRERLEHEEKGSDDYKLLHREVVSLVEQETALEQQVVKLLAQKTAGNGPMFISFLLVIAWAEGAQVSHLLTVISSGIITHLRYA